MAGAGMLARGLLINGASDGGGNSNNSNSNSNRRHRMTRGRYRVYNAYTGAVASAHYRVRAALRARDAMEGEGWIVRDGGGNAYEWGDREVLVGGKWHRTVIEI